MLSPSISSLTNEQLRSELATQIMLTAESLYRAAKIWTELKRRGVDLSALRSGLALYLPRIARSELAAETIVAFAGQRTLLQHLVGMPLNEQRRYASGDVIDIVERDPEGQFQTVSRQLFDLSGREVIQVLEEGRVRSVDEQKSTLIRQNQQPTRLRRYTGSTSRISARNGLLNIGRLRLDPLDLAPALKSLGFELKMIEKVNIGK